MRKMLKIIFAFISIFLLLNGCGERGPMGHEGPRGPQGPAGPEILPTSFEFEVDLLRSNDFEFIQAIPSQIEVLSSDVMLAYVFEEYIAEDDLEVWRKLPLNEFNSSGTLLLDFDFTMIDVRIFLDANYTLSSADEFDGLLIRAVHIPADFLNTAKAQQAMQANTFDDLQQVIGNEVNHLKLD